MYARDLQRPADPPGAPACPVSRRGTRHAYVMVAVATQHLRRGPCLATVGRPAAASSSAGEFGERHDRRVFRPMRQHALGAGTGERKLHAAREPVAHSTASPASALHIRLWCGFRRRGSRVAAREASASRAVPPGPPRRRRPPATMRARCASAKPSGASSSPMCLFSPAIDAMVEEKWQGRRSRIVWRTRRE